MAGVADRAHSRAGDGAGGHPSRRRRDRGVAGRGMRRWRWSRQVGEHGAWCLPGTRDRLPPFREIEHSAKALRAAGFAVGASVDDRPQSVADAVATSTGPRPMNGPVGNTTGAPRTPRGPPRATGGTGRARRSSQEGWSGCRPNAGRSSAPSTVTAPAGAAPPGASSWSRLGCRQGNGAIGCWRRPRCWTPRSGTGAACTRPTARQAGSILSNRTRSAPVTCWSTEAGGRSCGGSTRPPSRSWPSRAGTTRSSSGASSRIAARHTLPVTAMRAPRPPAPGRPPAPPCRRVVPRPPRPQRGGGPTAGAGP